MKKATILTGVLALTVAVAMLGCKEKATVEGEAGAELTLTKPGNVTIERGGSAEVKIAISRKNLTGPVGVDFDDLPGGVTVVDEDKKIVGDEGTYNLQASDTAELLANHMAKVTVKGTEGEGISKMFSITVEEKKPE